MDMWIDKSPYWFKADGIKKIEELKSAVHMGHWCTRAPDGNWNEQPVDLFYVANPDISKGHSHYFGMFYRNHTLYITNGESAFPTDNNIIGVLADDGEVLVSRFRHDYQERKGAMIDGGRDYTRASSPARYVKVDVDGSEFKFTQLDF